MKVWAIAIHVVNRLDDEGRPVSIEPGGRFEVDEAGMVELEERGAARRDTSDPLDHDKDGRKGGSAPSADDGPSVRHRGGGKWGIVDAEGELMFEELFDSREEADEQLAQLSAIPTVTAD